jgi:hypothetical protein
MAFAASEQKAVGLAGFQQGSTDDDTRSSGEIGLGPVLNNPTALLEEEINLLASPLFWGSWVGQEQRVQLQRDRLLSWGQDIGGNDRI